MKKRVGDIALSLILLVSLIFTGLAGLIQSNLDLHKFRYHKYGAYFTLFCALIHVIINLPVVIKYFKHKRHKPE